ncbi:universal stress protein PHOS32-like [Prosopis cineraria]|uniref:universal stress protein PHOS32-like n=1 Tax=Prosopis cineraria TaxID=364024 RepID=UPI00240F85F7|nr:universal stress protein PHOS32-like [Prosopis cineraria]
MAEKERRILVAVDEGEESMYTLSWCIHNLVFPNSNDILILLHCKPPRPVFPALDGTGYLFSSDISVTAERCSDRVENGVVERAQKLCVNLQQVKVETRVENGDPRDVICEMAEKLGADVLVMGSHGYGLIKRALLGSVSNHCAQNVKCPVLIVKKPKTSLPPSHS